MENVYSAKIISMKRFENTQLTSKNNITFVKERGNEEFIEYSRFVTNAKGKRKRTGKIVFHYDSTSITYDVEDWPVLSLYEVNITNSKDLFEYFLNKVDSMSI